VLIRTPEFTFVKPLALLLSNLLVFYVVTGHCIQAAVKGVELSKKEDITPRHCARVQKEQSCAL
jgi:hypothetical protein